MSKIKRKSENGGNINGAVQIEGRSVEAAKRRGPKSKFSEVLFERVWRRVAGGEGLMASIKAEGMGASRFYECVARKPELAAALQKAREQGSAPVLRRAGGTTPVLRSSNDTEDGEGGLQPLRQGSTLHPLRLRRGGSGDGRVFAGAREPASSTGMQPGKVRQLSDRMLMFLLQSLAPEKYGKALR